MGLLVSDLKRDYVRTRVGDLEEVDVRNVQAQFEDLEQNALEELTAENIAAGQIQFERALDLRYAIQKYELAVRVSAGELTEQDTLTWRRLFDERHVQQYGTRATDQRVEIVNYHLTAKLPLPRPLPRKLSVRGESPDSALKGFRKAFFDAWIDTPVYARDRLGYGHHLVGPAIIEQVDSTIVIHPKQKARVDEFGNVIIEVAL